MPCAHLLAHLGGRDGHHAHARHQPVLGALFTLWLTLTFVLPRKIPQTVARVREGNYTLSGLTGFEMRGKTVAVIGTGAIGYYAVLILQVGSAYKKRGSR